METLAFQWYAVLKNGEIINQYVDGQDFGLKRVLDRHSEVETFHLVSPDKSKHFTVNLQYGLVHTEPAGMVVNQFNTEKGNIRLIHKRIVRQHLTKNVEHSGKEIWYILGVQYNDVQGVNHKLILQIDEHGNWILGD